MAASCLLVAGCSALLPSSRQATASPWKSYQEAELAFDKILPGVTTEADLRLLNLQPGVNPNIAILNYSDVLMRFMPHASISIADLDGGVRLCISAKTGCKGFEISQSIVAKNRNGNFVADVLGFSRNTQITGWKFNGLLLLKDGVVIYKLTGGQPAIAQHEVEKTPLGPVQSLGRQMLGF
ncbi:MAG: hypothetical protein ACREUN_11235 [Burkholderiales bacterium]